MATDDALTSAEPRAVVMLRVGNDRSIRVASIDGSTRCDLGLVEDLLRMRIMAAEFGWSVEIVEVCDRLRELFDLVGLTDQLATP